MVLQQNIALERPNWIVKAPLSETRSSARLNRAWQSDHLNNFRTLRLDKYKELILSTDLSMKCEEALREEALRESSPNIRLTLAVRKSWFFVFLTEAELFNSNIIKKQATNCLQPWQKKKNDSSCDWCSHSGLLSSIIATIFTLHEMVSRIFF